MERGPRLGAIACLLALVVALAACRPPGVPLSAQVAMLQGAVTLPAPLVSNNSSKLVSNAGGNLVSNAGSGLVSSNASKYRVATVQADQPVAGLPIAVSRWDGQQWSPAGATTTDARGRFSVPGLPVGALVRVQGTGSMPVAPAALVRLDGAVLEPATGLAGAWTGYTCPQQQLRDPLGVTLPATIVTALVLDQAKKGGSGLLAQVSNTGLKTLEAAVASDMTDAQVAQVASGSLSPLGIYQQVASDPRVVAAAAGLTVPDPSPSPVVAGATPAGAPSPTPAPTPASTASAPPAATPTPAAPFLAAVEPRIARVGDTLTLEGTFGPTATVNFGGGASAPATVLGSGRLSVVVPVGATAGAVSVSSGGTTTNALAFQVATFLPSVQNFQEHHEQTAYARSDATLVRPTAYGTGCVVGSYFYAIGGYGNGILPPAVQRALVNADGTLGPFQDVAGVTLNVDRIFPTVAVLGNHLYVIGGYSPNTNQTLSSIEQATVNGDGTLSAFTVAPGSLTVPRTQHASVVAGRYVYVIGGATDQNNLTGTTLGSVERAVVNSDGTLGTFATVPGVTLNTPRTGAPAAVVGNTLFVAGGNSPSSYRYDVEAAAIAGDGSLSPFTVQGSALAAPHINGAAVAAGGKLVVFGDRASSTAVEAASVTGGTLAAFSTVASLTEWRSGAFVVQAGNTIYAAGGYGAARLASVDHASLYPFGAGSQLPSFAAGTSLGTARIAPAVAVLGQHLYVIGGYNGGPLTSVEVATVRPDGSLSAFSDAGVSLTAGRGYAGCAVIGNRLYVLGGFTGTGRLASIDVAPIAADGTLGSFSASGATLAAADDGFTAAVVGNHLYVMGGFTGTYSNAVWTTSFDPTTYALSGNLAATANTLGGQTPFGAMSAVLGSHLYVVGGMGGSTAGNAIAGAVVNADGTLQAFANPGPILGEAVGSAGCALLGNQLVEFGGNMGWQATARSPVNADGTFAGNGGQSVTQLLSTGRDTHQALVLGNHLLMIGGWAGDPSNPTTTTLTTLDDGLLQ